MRIAKNLTIIATYNPIDRSAIDIDDALLRRLRIIDMQPDNAQLEEMLLANGLEKYVIDHLKEVFDSCRRKYPQEYEALMPFGHGIFAEVHSESDLSPLWHQRLRRMLYRPLLDPHAFAETIAAAYPWRDPKFAVPKGASANPENP
jgi:5-methylcytosine-specific restriction protein B